ncbi:MAG: hypothetical protein KAT69_03195 [Candidatus Aminicenantes bacterium]|nr:hypothetical protein [Candidatus Aminicenantes bacterium]
MTIANGDDLVSGNILSFQEANRIKNNWRSATAPSNPQAGMLFSDSDDEKLYHRQASAWMVVMQADNSFISTLAAGGYAFRIDAYQDDVTALTGLLRGAYIQASNGDIAATGTIRALELKARAGRPGEVGNNVAVLEGLSISADAKTYDITTVMRGIEISLDGAAGSTITKAVGLRIAQNFQADIATLCYGLEFYRDSFENDADIILSSGGMIGGKAGDLRIDEDGKVYIYDEDSVDRISIYHDKTNAFIKWSDGHLFLQTDEGIDTHSVIGIKGKGTGYGFLRLYDENDLEWLQFYSSYGAGVIKMTGTNPGILSIQHDTAQDIKLWGSITAGNPNLYIYGYQTGVGVKYGRHWVNPSGFYKIDAELRGYLQQGGVDMAYWTVDKLNLLDDKIIAFGAAVDMCMGYMDTGDIWHLCDQATLGANIRISINATGLSFFGVAPVAQAGHIGDTGGDDAAVVNAILVVLENLGLIASA